MKNSEKRKLTEIVFREDLYPRLETNAVTVQNYACNLDVLPPIEVNQHNEIIDGWHRWTAHKKAEQSDICVTVTKTQSDAHLLELAIQRNATHGLQLSQEDKRSMACRIYHGTAEKERDIKKRELAKLLSVSERTIRGWFSRIDKDTKEARNRRIFNLWLACWTQEEIAKEVGVDKQRVSELICPDLAKLPKADKARAEHAVDFEVPIYNIWKQQEQSRGVGHFGNSEIRWLDNLLYLYTHPFDIVVDPFAGGGSTIDLCKKRLRRYYVSDRKPIVEREKDIRQHDVSEGVPKVPRWKDVRLVYLDPPYWKQAEGKYSNDPSDLANMPLEQFTLTLGNLIRDFGKRLSGMAYIALIIQPTQWKAPHHQFIDHIADMLRLVKLPLQMRYSVPYECQQYTAQMVEWAKKNKRTLVLTREIIVWRVSE